ncbi:MAG: flagellar basal body P-ring protein FlgI [Planctomycetes bacterium]|nr:flagellar basal body P-ring protein FlgI [Planctomycetota bacterium]
MITALLLALALQQEPKAAPTVDTRLQLGGVEAPKQPELGSRATFTQTPRAELLGTTRAPTRLAMPIGSVATVRGQEDNTVMGIGLVTGLAGTGDSIEAARQLLANLLLTRNIKVDLQQISSKNVAIVQVEAVLPAGIKPGQKIDVTVSAIGDSTSLQGGSLSMTELTEITGRVVYATASGPVTIGGFSAEGQGASAKKNHTTVGTLPQGGKCEREVPTRLASEHSFVYLDLRSGQESLANVVNVVDAINALFPRSAEALPDGRSVKVKVPVDLPESQHVAYVNAILRKEIETEDLARVIVNERSGVIVMGGNVRLRSGAIAQGSITVTIAETPQVSQPGPLSNGQTKVVPRTDLNVSEENRPLVLVPGAATLQEVVDVLNVLGTTPRDLISILQAMQQGGMLVAEIRRM